MSTRNLLPTNEAEPGRGERPRSAEAVPRFVQDFVDRYVAEGERLRLGGVEPVATATQLIAAYPALRDYLFSHAVVLGARGVVSAEIEAGGVLVQRLSALLQRGAGGGAEVGPDPCGEAAAKLRQIHDTLRQQLRSPETAALRSRFGLDRPIKAGSLTAVLRALDQLLVVLREQREQLLSLRLVPADIEQIEATRGRLLELRRTPASAVDPAVMLQGRLALDVFFASIGAAITAAFPPEDPRCAAGLGLIPRLAERKRTRSPLRPWRASYPTTDD